jgi:molybdopterin-binding protein
MKLSACNLVPAKVVRIRQGEASSVPTASGSPARSRSRWSAIGIPERGAVSAVVRVSDVMIAIGD